MPALIAAESTLTDRYQTTVPEPVRKALGLTKRDKISYTIRSDGEVVLARAESEEEADPALEPFLHFLAQDIAQHPENLQALDASLLQRVQALTKGMVVDMKAPLSADDE